MTFFQLVIKLKMIKNRTASSKYVSGMQKDLFFCRLPNGIYKITSDANDEQKWV